jgi:hypothetical protein
MKMETTARGIFLHLLHVLGSLEAGQVVSVAHPFMTISSNEVVEAQRNQPIFFKVFHSNPEEYFNAYRVIFNSDDFCMPVVM